jgi:hypothetical protein
MTEARKKMIERIKAMLNSSGRTEAEMMAFLAKVSELMATYEITEAELAAGEKAKIHRTEMADPYDIKKNLCMNVGKFTSCAAYRDRDKAQTICFAGKEGDILFATWLLDTLQRFVMRELRNYQKKLIVEKGGNHSNNLTSDSFVAGCTFRINEKLAQLIPVNWADTKALILKETGLSLVKSRGPSAKTSEKDVAAGIKAGEHATFNRPVGAGGWRYLK